MAVEHQATLLLQPQAQFQAVLQILLLLTGQLLQAALEILQTDNILLFWVLMRQQQEAFKVML